MKMATATDPREAKEAATVKPKDKPRALRESISYQPTGGGGKAAGGKGARPRESVGEVYAAKAPVSRGLAAPCLPRLLRSATRHRRQSIIPTLTFCFSKKPHKSFYNHAWETKPLELHDKHLVSAKRFTCGENLVRAHTTNSAVLDVSDEISGILSNHPGPIAHFRIDTSKWRDESVLVRWLQMLSNKSVQEITVLNLCHKTSTGFPVEELQDGRLSALSIGFMTLPDLDLSCFNYSALQVLCLFSCTFEGLKLGWIITDCVSLRELRVGFPTENLKINSKSLEMVVVWGTKASWLVIGYAPKLDVLMTSIFPREGDARVKPKRSHPTVSISINNADSLREVNYLLLQYHIITVNSVPISKKYVPWNSVKNLKLGLNVSSAAQRDSLRKILDSVPMLLELCIRRMDDIGRDEGFDMIIDCPFEDLNHVTCVTTCLSRFSVEEFRGGAAELHMIKCVLRHAPHLLELCTTHC